MDALLTLRTAAERAGRTLTEHGHVRADALPELEGALDIAEEVTATLTEGLAPDRACLWELERLVGAARMMMAFSRQDDLALTARRLDVLQRAERICLALEAALAEVYAQMKVPQPARVPTVA